MYEVAVTAQFSAAHQLRGHWGPCKDLHGHNWTVEAAFASKKLDKHGMVVDFHHVKEQLERLMKLLDHKVINEVPPFTELDPTAERMAEWFFKELKASLPVPPSYVTIYETDHAWATYRAK